MSRVRLVRFATLLCLLVLTTALDASADWLVIPFFGSTFASQTTLLDLELSAGRTKKLILGGSGLWLSDGLIGVEGDFSYVPGFFERKGQLELIVGSSVSTLSGSVIVAVPLSVTRDSLRPYLVGGLGLLHAGIEDLRNLSPVDENLLALNLGGGAIGLVTRRTGVRFELRQFRSVTGPGPSLMGAGRTRLSFWRATIGVVARY